MLLNRARDRGSRCSPWTRTPAKPRHLLTETDPAWLNLDPDYGLSSAGAKTLPYWLPDGSASCGPPNAAAIWQLELHHADGSLDHAITPHASPFLALNDVDPTDGTVVVTARPDRLDTAALPHAASPAAPRRHSPPPPACTTSPPAKTSTASSPTGHPSPTAPPAPRCSTPTGKTLATLPSFAEHPPRAPNLQFTTAGPLDFDAVVIRPHDFKPGKHYPVVLSVYGGPTVKLVLRAQRLFLEDQCLADQGFVVATLDGRGTPGRDHDFERATKYDLIDLPLQDQIAGLQALGKRFPEMDTSRVGVTGWSFGGYFTAMATIRRPDVFHAGVAGAPVVDFADYDTAYTERYLGTPQQHPDGLQSQQRPHLRRAISPARCSSCTASPTTTSISKTP